MNPSNGTLFEITILNCKKEKTNLLKQNKI